MRPRAFRRDGWLRPLPACILAVAACVACCPGWSRAGTYNPDRAVGDVVPEWTDLPGTDGRLHAWADLKDRDFVVVVFTCNGCPYAVDYEDRINVLAQRCADEGGRVAVVAFNSNQVAEDSLPAMRRRAEARGFRFPYLRDESQAVARSFGALRTPEFFLIDRERRIVYMGAMDDDARAADVRQRYLEDALVAVRAGRPPAVTETAPVGCLIRFARRGRGR